MVTKQQAMDTRHGTEFHIGACKRTTGPRGGVTETVTRVRVSGRCQTWKRDEQRFRLPVKFGLYRSLAITHINADDFHHANDCPLRATDRG